MDTLKTYTIGAVAGLLAYHYVLRKEFPSLPSLNAMNSMQRTQQQLIQENRMLRGATNQAMQRLAITQSGEAPPDARQRQRELTFGFMSNREYPKTMGFVDGIARHPDARFNPSNPNRYFVDRQRRYGSTGMGFDQQSGKTARERRYGFAGSNSPPLTPFGMR